MPYIHDEPSFMRMKYRIQQKIRGIKFSPIAHPLYWGEIFAKFNFANRVRSTLQKVVGGAGHTVCEFLSDAPFSNLVSGRCALPTNCACVSGWSCTMNLQLGSSKTRLSYTIRQGE